MNKETYPREKEEASGGVRAEPVTSGLGET